MEHEAEKYQQRLQAIAEKRRLQEEQERVRREKEDERLRIQQLKRKSLRDQWLMEGPPTSPDSAGPRSPLWGSKAQEIETNINKLQEKSEQLAEEEDKLQKLIDEESASSDAQTQKQGEASVEALGSAAETTPNGPIVENGQEDKKDDSVDAEKHEAEGAEDAEPVTDDQTESTAVLNGNLEEETSDNTPGRDQPASVNGFTGHHLAEGAAGVTMTFLGFKEAEPGQGVDEDDDGGAVIRAERVIITDEGEEVPEEEDGAAQETTTDAKNEDACKSTEAAGSEEETQNQPESSVDLEKAKVVEDFPAEEIVIKAEEVEGEEKMEKDLPSSIEAQAQNLKANTEASQVQQPSPTIRPKHEENTTESRTPKDVEAVATTRISLGQFQDVPLDESNTKAETEKQGVEQEPLLVSKTSAQLDTSAPNRAEDTGAPKQKTCQCCSVM